MHNIPAKGYKNTGDSNERIYLIPAEKVLLSLQSSPQHPKSLEILAEERVRRLITSGQGSSLLKRCAIFLHLDYLRSYFGRR